MASERGERLLRLRDLGAIAEIESLLVKARSTAGKSWMWCKHYEAAQAEADRVSKRTFGIVEVDTRYVDDPELSKGENDNEGGWWDSRFHLFERSNGPASDADWASVGWDVNDENGKPLDALRFFYRQIVATAFGLCGHLPGEDADLSDAEVEQIAVRLQAEAAKFKRESRR